jgi:hypothetical protein
MRAGYGIHTSYNEELGKVVACHLDFVDEARVLCDEMLVVRGWL